MVFTCPVCRSHEAHWVAAHNELRVARCDVCSHGYVWPVPDSEFLDAIYRDPGYYRGAQESYGFVDYGSLAPARRRMFSRHLSTIERMTGVGRILDVGSATGDFLLAAKQRGWDVFAADPSAARSEIKAAGLDLVGTTVHDVELAEASLDAVTFWDVLEHVPAPMADLKRARELLKPGGVIALTVPDAANLLARVSGRRWFGYKTAGEHLQFFTRASLRMALEKTGIAVRELGPTRWSCTIGFLADRAGLYMGAPGRLLRATVDRSWTGSIVVDLPQINQFALGTPTTIAS